MPFRSPNWKIKLQLTRKKLTTSLTLPTFTKVISKPDDISNQLATMLQINKVHFAKVTDLMEQKISAAVAISERLIHTAYDHRL
jgi:hypothetical protein